MNTTQRSLKIKDVSNVQAGLSMKGDLVIEPGMTGAALGSENMPFVMPRFKLDFHAFCMVREMAGRIPDAPALGSRFASRLAMYLPEVADQIEESDFGFLHLEVGVLKLATRNSILTRDWRRVRLHFSFVANILSGAGAELRDALHVSYLGNLFYGETAASYAQARMYLPISLGIALEIIERHYEDLAE